ncbi:unnamed protein product [Allacma fusca]|uniref:Uncharacterized protein n=1 Tax=Allacma fusca TaxID=39272 RepID=A0A8J2NTS7_9HEXA|nr:unnamed protein product [Allacma fusca]
MKTLLIFGLAILSIFTVVKGMETKLVGLCLNRQEIQQGDIQDEGPGQVPDIYDLIELTIQRAQRVVERLKFLQECRSQYMDGGE